MSLFDVTWLLQTKPGEVVSKLMAKRCDLCPACTYARRHPEGWFGRMVAWHGQYCPFWHAWQREYGEREQSVTQSPGE